MKDYIFWNDTILMGLQDQLHNIFFHRISSRKQKWNHLSLENCQPTIPHNFLNFFRRERCLNIRLPITSKLFKKLDVLSRPEIQNEFNFLSKLWMKFLFHTWRIHRPFSISDDTMNINISPILVDYIKKICKIFISFKSPTNFSLLS